MVSVEQCDECAGDVSALIKSARPVTHRSHLKSLSNSPRVHKVPACGWTMHTVAFEWLKRFPPQSEHKEPAAWALLLHSNGNELVQHEPLLRHGQGQSVAWRTGGCWQHPGSRQEGVCLPPAWFSLGGHVSATIPVPQSKGAPSGS